MVPKIPISFPHIRRMVFGSASPIPALVQDEIAQLVIDDVIMAYINPMKTMPEYLQLVKGWWQFKRLLVPSVAK